MEPMILGLHGRIGAGKNECARRLALIRDGVVEVSFAAKLKESAAALLGCTVADLERWKNEQYAVLVRDDEPKIVLDQTVRSFLQRYGTEAHRDVFGQDFWLDAALPLDGDYHPDVLYTVTDVRFPNEAQRVRDVGGVMVGIVGAFDTPSDHASEQTLECDHWIDNTIRDDDHATLDRLLLSLLREISPPLAA
jgi:hypothetical protein